MDQIDQENELQKAIDDITKNGGGDQGADVAAGLEEQIQNQMGTPPVPPMAPAGEGPAEAMPPMPEGDGGAPEGVAPEEVSEGAVPDAGVVDGGVAEGGEVAIPEMPVPETPAEGLTDAAVPEGEAPAEVAPEAVAEVTETVDVPVDGGAPVVTEDIEVGLSDMGGNDITSVKEAMLRDLFPIMDKVEMAAEEKFDLYKRMLDDTNDKSLISGAYEVVKGIADEGARAEALLFLIKKADA